MHLPFIKRANRVEANTSDTVNQRLKHQTENSVRYHAQHPGEVSARLCELDREWTIERALEANASLLIVSSSLLGALVNRRFFAVPPVVGTFLLQHALQGWCPPLPVLRRLGLRTAREINDERTALQALQNKH